MTTRIRTIRQRCRAGKRDRGAAAVVIGISLLAILGASSLAVDLGNHRATNSRTTTASDAAALAAAIELTAGSTESDACAAAATVVAANEAGATLHSCASEISTNGATIVSVEVREDVQYLFAQAIGGGSGTVQSISSARWGPVGVQGARPFALCISSLAGLLVGWDSNGATSIGPVQVPYGKAAQPAACNGGDPVPGNWGSLDFDGGSNSNADQQDWIENGYDGTVLPNVSVEGNPGALAGSVAGSLDSLIIQGATGETFPVPIFGTVSGNGANTEFQVIGFVDVHLTDYKVNGSADSRWLEFVFHPGKWPGVQCCDINGPSINLFASGICATDEDTDAC